MKVRNLENLPLLLADTAREVGRVQRAVVGDDFELAYLVIKTGGDHPGIVFRSDFTLGKDAVLISDPDCIKSYAHGEESSIYEKKLGDTVFDGSGRQLGTLSDFILCPKEKRVWGLEVSGGVFKDILDGRQEIPLETVRWASIENAVVEPKRSDRE
jgi:uncharacterized protein YrrD